MQQRNIFKNSSKIRTHSLFVLSGVYER